MTATNARLIEEIGRRNSAENELRDAKEELQLVMSSIPDHLWSLQFDADGWLVNCFHSAVVESITGRPPEFFLGGTGPWLGIAYPEDVELVRATFDRAVRGEVDEQSVEFRIRRPDGELRWVHKSIRATSMLDGTRRLNGANSTAAHSATETS